MEKSVHKAVVNYLKTQFPKVIFRSDYGAGVRLTIGQAKAQKALQNGMAYPDLFIAKAAHGYHGLFLELKDYGVEIYRKNGNYVNDHYKAQAECLVALENEGYIARFACGFDEAKAIIDNYLTGLYT